MNIEDNHLLIQFGMCFYHICTNCFNYTYMGDRTCDCCSSPNPNAINKTRELENFSEQNF